MKLNSNELKDFVIDILETNNILEKQGKRKVSLEVKGIAGIGKTSIFQQIGKEKKLPVVKINLAQIEEIGDLVGFPIKEYELKKGNELKWVDEMAYNNYVSNDWQSTGQNRMSYAAPEWIQNISGTKGGILLLDDWTRADYK